MNIAFVRAGSMLALLLLVSACGNSSAPGAISAPPGPVGVTPVDNSPPPSPPGSLDAEIAGDMLTFNSCEFLDNHYCQFPWPSDWLTTADAGTDTGRRVNLDIAQMPRNIAGKPLDPAEWNRNDGFSPGQAILLRVENFDLARTGAVPITDIADGSRADQPVVVLDVGPAEPADPAYTPRRQLIWTEVDANISASAAAPPTADPGPAMVIRPAINFTPGHRYIVALRKLKDADGTVLEAPAAFRIYRDNYVSMEPLVEGRRAHFEELFGTLGRAGIARSELYLAWDFTVASERNLTERALHIRDEALASLNDGAPAFTIDSVINNPVNGDASPITARRIRGHVTVPCYMTTPNCVAGGTFNYTPSASGLYGDGLPDRTAGVATANVPFICSIARATYNGASDPAAATSFTPARISLYGHGLLGSRDEGNTYDLNVRDMAQRHNFVFCMMDWAGLETGNTPDDPQNDPMKYDPAWDGAGGDLATTVTILNDMSNLPKLADRFQQGYLNFIFLGRAMLHAQGLCTNAAFQVGGQCILDRSELYYDGNSQGGINGGALVALSPDIKAGVLGVPGMNYSTLLQRSVDFDTYAPLLYNSYPGSLDQQFVLSMVQMLWDRAENDGYAWSLAPGKNLPGTPPKRLLLTPAFGDHQVAMVSAEVMARTIGARLHCPAVVGGSSPQRSPAVQPGVHPAVSAEAAAHPEISFNRRHPDDEPYYGLECIAQYPHAGNALVVWDSGPTTTADGSPSDVGVAPPPINNTPPRPELGYGPIHTHSRAPSPRVRT
jgi:hypothetical protein